jgi:phosphoglycolate phosphatase-like HAD superfamily hydrolase
MRIRTTLLATAVLAAGTLVGGPTSVLAQDKAPADPLPSWNDGPIKKSITDFVARVTKEGGPDFVPVPERIATFDNDGTLWAEQPLYFQLAFALDRVKMLVGKHPEWKEQEPYRSILAGETTSLVAAGEKAFVDVVAATHTGMTTEEFEAIVRNWLRTARHPRFNRPYTDLVYQPMLELLAYLRASGFKTFVVSGGGIDFMRPWVPRAYGIPPEQIVGSSNKLRYDLRDGQPVLLRLPAIDFIDDKAGKPVGIHKFIGRRPIMAFGNSDGDYEMLRWTTAAPGARFGLIVHHTDAEREWAYDRWSFVGRLERALDEAPQRGWVVVDMKKDWKVIFPFQK